MELYVEIILFFFFSPKKSQDLPFDAGRLGSMCWGSFECFIASFANLSRHIAQSGFVLCESPSINLQLQQGCRCYLLKTDFFEIIGSFFSLFNLFAVPWFVVLLKHIFPILWAYFSPYQMTENNVLTEAQGNAPDFEKETYVRLWSVKNVLFSLLVGEPSTIEWQMNRLGQKADSTLGWSPVNHRAINCSHTIPSHSHLWSI